MQIHCSHCATIMTVPDQAAQLGGVFTCPRCHVATTFAPMAALAGPPTRAAAKPATTAMDKFVRGLLICVGVCVGGIILVQVSAIFAVVLGALASTLAVLYLVRADIRPRVDAVFRARDKKPWRKHLVAALAGVWSFCMLFLYGGWVATGGPSRADAARAAHAAAERESTDRKRQEEADAQRALVEAKLDEAEKLLDAGQVVRAREIVEQVKGQSSANAHIAEVAEMIDKRAAEQALESLPEKRNAILDKAKAGAWTEAGSLCLEARKISSRDPQIEAACGEVDMTLRKLEVGKWIAEATRVTVEQCDVPAALGDAWTNLRKIRADEQGYDAAKAVAVKMEKCRKASERTLSAGVRTVMINQRVQWADRYETSLLDKGIDASVTLHGKQKDQVKIRWVLVGRAMVHQITKDGEFLTELEKIGFKRVTFSDGYYESWYFDLTPESEEESGKLALRGVGLDQPIKM